MTQQQNFLSLFVNFARFSLSFLYWEPVYALTMLS